ncbi:hypothetical protein AB835_14170 [Candidatus Endobugula sertula]|uniref:Uncharacterized protein n=1 Tax=Candidatus Endobugula sertula TaxID=62101 RepID=A0A1D2QLJ1_9GAMM|nr:hypothetical protein AB835_14170 [Candidatus Endobugula sertula]
MKQAEIPFIDFFQSRTISVLGTNVPENETNALNDILNGESDNQIGVDFADDDGNLVVQLHRATEAGTKFCIALVYTKPLKLSIFNVISA